MRVVRFIQTFAKIPQGVSPAIVALALCLTAAFVTPSHAQKAEKSARKVVVTVKPDYPEVLKRAQVGGVVRLKVTVQPNGTVSNVEVLGGNPILADSAAVAVKRWKYAPAPTETVENPSLTFSPN